MKYIKMITLVAVLLLAGNVHNAYAQKKIGYLDLSKVFNEYDKTKAYDSVLETKHSAYEKERNAKIEKLKEKQGKLALLKEGEKEKAQQEIEQLRNELLEFDQAQRTDLTKQQDEKVREILLEVENVVSEYAKKEGYDVVLNDRVLIFGSDTLNISDSILKILNDTYNKKQ